MSTAPSLALVDPYLNAAWRESRSPFAVAAETHPFVTVSGEAGAGGRAFARLLARRLNAESGDGVLWRVYEGDVVAKMLDENRLPRRLARYLPEERVPELAATIGELVGLHPNLWHLVQKTNETMCHLAAGGHVILVGRGANFATEGVEGGTHVRLVAPADHRARFLAGQYNVSLEQARRLNARGDAARRSYVRANFGRSISDPGSYDLVINTGHVPLPEAAKLVCTRLAAATRPPAVESVPTSSRF